MFEYNFDSFLLDEDIFNFTESNAMNLDKTELNLMENFTMSFEEIQTQSEPEVYYKIELIQMVILVKKENNILKQRLKFLENLLQSKQEERRLVHYIFSDFIKDAKKKEEEFKLKLNLDDENSIETYYPINIVMKNACKTEKRKPRKNKKAAIKSNQDNKIHNNYD